LSRAASRSGEFIPQHIEGRGQSLDISQDICIIMYIYNYIYIIIWYRVYIQKLYVYIYTYIIIYIYILYTYKHSVHILGNVTFKHMTEIPAMGNTTILPIKPKVYPSSW
jgi:Ca2+/Na+ antiporter